MQLERAQRIDYIAPIQLLCPDGLSIEGRVANLSESGAFVTTREPFEVGAEVFCGLPLSGKHLRLRGEVVWVQEMPDHEGVVSGMGIRFVDLSPPDAVALRHLVIAQEGRPQSVVVYFEGYERPIRASALVTERGLQLWTSLPFLRLSSPVNVAFSDEDPAPEGRSRRGVLSQVALDLQQGVPRLQIDVGLTAEQQAAVEQQSWKPGQVIYAAPDYVVEAVEPQQDEDLVVSISDRAGAARVVKPSPAVASCSGEIETTESRSLATSPSTSTADPSLGSVQVEAQADVASDPAGESHWELGAPHVADEAPYQRFWSEAERRRHRTWLWIAALLMAGIAVASMVQTEFWQRVSDRLWPDRVAAATADQDDSIAPALLGDGDVEGQGPSDEDESIAAALGDDEAAQEDREHPAVDQPAKKAAPVHRAKVVKVVKAEGRGEQGRLDITEEAGAATLTIPFAGSSAEARHYRLAAPDGVAINLPNAQPRLPLGHYAINRDGIRAVWLRERRGGVQVRVFFSEGPVDSQVQIEAQQLRVRIEKGREAP